MIKYLPVQSVLRSIDKKYTNIISYNTDIVHFHAVSGPDKTNLQTAQFNDL